VTTARGEAVVLFLFFFFCSMPFTAEIAAATAEADFFPTVDLVLRRDFAAPVVWTSLGPLPRWVPGPTTRWAPGTTRLALRGT
jgi:hypothetical protein